MNELPNSTRFLLCLLVVVVGFMFLFNLSVSQSPSQTKTLTRASPLNQATAADAVTIHRYLFAIFLDLFISSSYWCSFGPENYTEVEDILPSRRFRLNTRNRAARAESMRGCTCKFVVKRLYARPSDALIIYNNRRQHVNDFGIVCHGPRDGNAIGAGAKKTPYISNDIKQRTMSMFYLGYSPELVLQKQMVGIRSYCGSNPNVDKFAPQFVRDIGWTINRSTHELDLDDKKKHPIMD